MLDTICVSYDKLKVELELLQQHNIIVPIMEATEWYVPIVVTPRENTENICMCVDLSHLNQYVQEWHMPPTPAEAIADNIVAANAKHFTVLDAMKGYHQCPFDQNNQLLTTFIIPFGRFKYLWVTYGIFFISEH